MKMKITKEWLMKNAERDQDLEVTAGSSVPKDLNKYAFIKEDDGRRTDFFYIRNLEHSVDINMEAFSNERSCEDPINACKCEDKKCLRFCKDWFSITISAEQAKEIVKTLIKLFDIDVKKL